MISFLLLYLVLVFSPTLLPFNGLFLTPIHLVLLSYLLLHLWSLLTPLPSAGLFTYSSTLHWSLSYSFKPCAGLTLVSFTPLPGAGLFT